MGRGWGTGKGKGNNKANGKGGGKARARNSVTAFTDASTSRRRDGCGVAVAIVDRDGFEIDRSCASVRSCSSCVPEELLITSTMAELAGLYEALRLLSAVSFQLEHTAVLTAYCDNIVAVECVIGTSEEGLRGMGAAHLVPIVRECQNLLRTGFPRAGQVAIRVPDRLRRSRNIQIVDGRASWARFTLGPRQAPTTVLSAMGDGSQILFTLPYAARQLALDRF